MRTKRMHHDPLLLGGGFRHTENDRVESWWRRNPSRQRTGMAGDRDLSWKTLSDLPDVSQDAQLFTRPVRGNRVDVAAISADTAEKAETEAKEEGWLFPVGA